MLINLGFSNFLLCAKIINIVQNEYPNRFLLVVRREGKCLYFDNIVF